ncbi:MAG: ABC transporter permease [Solobacterium sp.]|nr:ABC transporter permease [Solobacterium sp.]
MKSTRALSRANRENTVRSVLTRLFRENRMAAVSFAVIILFILAAIFAPLLTPYSWEEMDLIHRLNPPSAAHLFGTDEAGRDIFTRMLYGSRVSLLVGILPSMVSLAIGSLLGVTAGYYGGWLDAVIMRLADIVLAFPSMLLAMVLMYMLGGGLFNVFLTLSLVNWASAARIIRAETLQLKEREFVESARTIGVRSPKIIFRHILPNCVPTIIVLFTLNIPDSILTESSLSFLGLGVQPPAASWGLMVNAGRQFFYTSPWLCLFPGIAVMIIVLAFHFLGDGLRDILDPRRRKQ